MRMSKIISCVLSGELIGNPFPWEIELFKRIRESQPINLNSMRLRLRRKNLSIHFGAIRDYYATYMLEHGLLREEVDILQGRVPSSILVRHYWSPNFKEMKTRVLKATKQLEDTLNSTLSL